MLTQFPTSGLLYMSDMTWNSKLILQNNCQLGCGPTKSLSVDVLLCNGDKPTAAYTRPHKETCVSFTYKKNTTQAHIGKQAHMHILPKGLVFAAVPVHM